MALSTEEETLSRVEAELKRRGWSVKRTPPNSPQGDIWAYSPDDERCIRIEVKGLKSKSAIWLKKAQAEAVDLVVIIQLDKNKVWVLGQRQVLKLLEDYQREFKAKNGRPPAQEGFNASQFPRATGWRPLDDFL